MRGDTPGSVGEIQREVVIDCLKADCEVKRERPPGLSLGIGSRRSEASMSVRGGRQKYPGRVRGSADRRVANVSMGDGEPI
jgi:hypothetical protein